MSDFASAPATKWWATSTTIRGVLITAATTVLPAIAAAAGLDVGLVRLFGEQAVAAVQSIGGLIGTGMAIAGRVRAQGPVTMRNMTIRI